MACIVLLSVFVVKSVMLWGLFRFLVVFGGCLCSICGIGFGCLCVLGIWLVVCIGGRYMFGGFWFGGGWLFGVLGGGVSLWGVRVFDVFLL